ncbi:hypothetical protein Tco_0703217 [Tanacetum coccineum]|uniref:Uncharacterized protein n=1 Tax=Tanacetum coccineum TaxID=301880 RepID=A0ABQ4XYR0_9ASTR
MNQEQIQQAALDQALVSIDDQVKISSRNMRIDPTKQKEATYQVVLDILKLSPCYDAFLITSDVPQIYMHQFWFTIAKNKNSSLYQVPNKEFVAPPPHDAPVTFLKQLGYKGSLDLISDIYNSLINTIKDDGVMGKLKFVSKGEDEQKYGMSIPDLMMNDEIKNFDAYLTYLALSTNSELPKVGKGKGKGKGKGPMAQKKADTPAPKGKKSTLKKKSSITADDNILPNPDESLKLTNDEISNETDDKEEGRLIRRRPTGVERLRHSQVSDQADEEIADEEQTDAEHDAKVKDKEEVADEETDDEEIANEEKDNKEITDTNKANEEIADAEKVNAEKTKEEKVDEEQSRDEQADKDDQAKDDHVEDNQARDLISVTHNEKPEFPPLSSSLSMSSDYGNQFFNVSSDISLVRTIKEHADTEIKSMLDVPVQHDIPPVQQTPLLDVLISVIPEQTIPSPSKTPPTTEVQATTVSETDPSLTVLQRISELEKKVAELSKVNHADVIEESV